MGRGPLVFFFSFFFILLYCTPYFALLFFIFLRRRASAAGYLGSWVGAGSGARDLFHGLCRAWLRSRALDSWVLARGLSPLVLVPVLLPGRGPRTRQASHLPPWCIVRWIPSVFDYRIGDPAARQRFDKDGTACGVITWAPVPASSERR